MAVLCAVWSLAGPGPARAATPFATGDFEFVPLVPDQVQTITLGAPDRRVEVAMPAALGDLANVVEMGYRGRNPSVCDMVVDYQRWDCVADPAEPATTIIIRYGNQQVPPGDYPRYLKSFPVTVSDPKTGAHSIVTTTVRPHADLAVSGPYPGWDYPTDSGTGLMVIIDDRGPSYSTSSRVLISITGPYRPAALPGSCTNSTGRITCAVGTIAPGGHEPIRIPLTPDSGPLTVQVTVTGTDPDPVPANNIAVNDTLNPFGRPVPGTARPAPGVGTGAPLPGGSAQVGSPVSSAAVPSGAPSAGGLVPVPMPAVRAAAATVPRGVLVAAGSVAVLLLAGRALVLRRRRRLEDAFARDGLATRDIHVELDRIRSTDGEPGSGRDAGR